MRCDAMHSNALAEEVLDGDNMYMCEKCKKKQRSVKQLTVYKYPMVLVSDKCYSTTYLDLTCPACRLFT